MHRQAQHLAGQLLGYRAAARCDGEVAIGRLLVQRARVNLSPLVIVLALIIGGSLAGLLGVLVAVPVTAAIRIIVGHFWRTRMLGESWREASEHMIEYTEPPDRIAGIRRRQPNQTRLFDTQELPSLVDDVNE